MMNTSRKHIWEFELSSLPEEIAVSFLKEIDRSSFLILGPENYISCVSVLAGPPEGRISLSAGPSACSPKD